MKYFELRFPSFHTEQKWNALKNREIQFLYKFRNVCTDQHYGKIQYNTTLVKLRIGLELHWDKLSKSKGMLFKSTCCTMAQSIDIHRFAFCIHSFIKKGGIIIVNPLVLFLNPNYERAVTNINSNIEKIKLVISNAKSFQTE